MTTISPDLSQPTCRVCLRNQDEEDMSSIFDMDTDINHLHIYEKIEQCAGIKILRHEMIPTLICKDCYGFLKVSYKFRTICRNANEYLKEFLINVKINTQIVETSPKENPLLLAENVNEEVNKRRRGQKEKDDAEVLKTSQIEKDKDRLNTPKDEKYQAILEDDDDIFDNDDDNDENFQISLDNLDSDTKEEEADEVREKDKKSERKRKTAKENTENTNKKSTKTLTTTTPGIEKDKDRLNTPKDEEYQAILEDEDDDDIFDNDDDNDENFEISLDDLDSDTKGEEEADEVREKDKKSERTKRTAKDKTEKTNKKPTKTLTTTTHGKAVIVERKPRAKRKKSEKQPQICDICGNIYSRRYALEMHMKRHGDVKPFGCEICPQAFYSNFELKRHMRKHTGVKPYKCRYCPSAFGDQSTLIKHERVHRNERPFKCDTCGKSFAYTGVLKCHKLTHTGEKPFSCELCGKCFTRSHHLRAHLETLQHASDPRSKILLQNIKKNNEGETLKIKNLTLTL